MGTNNCVVLKFFKTTSFVLMTWEKWWQTNVSLWKAVLCVCNVSLSSHFMLTEDAAEGERDLWPLHVITSVRAILTRVSGFRSFPNCSRSRGAKWRGAPWCRDRDCPRTTTSRRGTSLTLPPRILGFHGLFHQVSSLMSFLLSVSSVFMEKRSDSLTSLSSAGRSERGSRDSERVTIH